MPGISRNFLAMVLVTLTVIAVGVDVIYAVPITTVPEGKETPSALYAGSPPKADVVPRASIPQEPVYMFIRYGEQSRFEIFFLDARYGYDLVDFEFYNAWCLERNKRIRTNTLHQVRVYNVYDDDLPPPFKTMPWNEINYLINHKEGSKEVVQEAIWYFADQRGKPISPEAMRLVEKAALYGKDFKPGEGELLAIICWADGKQPVFIEFLLPATQVVDAFPVGYAPPPAVPELGWLPPWAPLGLLPVVMIPPFFLAGGSSDEPLPPPPPNILPPPPINPPPDNPPPSPIPEPSTVILIGSGLTGLLAYRRFTRGCKYRT